MKSRRAINKNAKQGKVSQRAVVRSVNGIADPRPYPVRLVRFDSICPTPVEPSHRCYMVLGWDLTLTTANPGFANTQLKLNSLFQPIGGAGEYGYGDELSALYGKWRIISSSIVVQATPTVTALHDIVLYPTVLAADAATSCQGARERRHAKSDVVLAGGNKAVVTLRSTETMSDLVGGSWRDDDYSATGAADPSHLCYWNIATAPRAAAIAGINLTGKVIAEVLFTELKPSASSS